MTASPPKNIFCIGLAGVGVSAVAKLFLARGCLVSGSDPKRNPLIDDLVKLGATYYPHEDPRLITPEFELVVYTDDTAPDHPLRRRSFDLGITAENFSVTLGRLMTEKNKRICIAGTNGKSTTTALTGLLLAAAGEDPTVVVGSRVVEFAGNVRVGQGDVFVAEADEYREHFLNYWPTVVILTNLEPDHLDYFGTVSKMIDSYRTFIKKIPAAGVLVANVDDPNVMTIAKHAPSVIAFGIHHQADLQASEIQQASGQQSWITTYRGKSLGRFTMALPGEFNIMNALAAMAGAFACGASPETFQQTIANFHGVWRRFQILNPKSSTSIISDYAHHPTAVRLTLAGARKFYHGRRIVAVFQPHHQARLTALFDDFTASFSSADEVVIVETFSVPGRNVRAAVTRTSQELVTALRDKKINAHFIPTLPELERGLPPLLRPGDVVIIMGAGDIWPVAEHFGKLYA